MHKILKRSLLFVLLLLQGKTLASTGTEQIYCETPRKNKMFSINKKSISIVQEKDFAPSRTLASVNARTKIRGLGFTKIMNFEGHKYSIHIENTQKFSNLNDSLTIKSPQGHQMTYPLHCSHALRY